MENREKQVSSADTGGHHLGANEIAKWLLASFVVSLVALLVVNVGILWGTGDCDKAWFELLKSGLSLLGTAMTTVIGYYFGTRDVRNAERRLNEKTEEAKEAKESVHQLARQLESLPLPSGMPEDFASAKSQLRKRVVKNSQT